MTVWIPVALLVLISVVWLLKRQVLLVIAVALLAFYGIGFLGPFLGEALRVVFAFAGLGLLVVVVASLARVASTKSVAATAAFVLVPLLFIALGYGIYEAHETGWQGLGQLGADSDSPGTKTIWLWFITGSPLWAVVGIVISAVAYRMCSPDTSPMHPTPHRPTLPIDRGRSAL